MRPVTGELPAHQISVVTGSTAFFVLVYALWHREADRVQDRTLARMGEAWLVGTILFEFAPGSSRGMSWEEMLHDYNIAAGRLWPVVLLVIAVSPIAVKRLAALRHHHDMIMSAQT